MGLPNEVNSALIGAANQGDYTIDQSLRFSDGGNYLTRTPSSAGSRTTWTYSAWVKYTIRSANHAVLLSAGSAGSNYDNIRITTTGHTPNNALSWYANNASYSRTAAKIRDPSAWYHFVFVWDTTNGTAADRRRMYINGVKQTAFYDNSNPSSSAESYVNNNWLHAIGALTYNVNTASEAMDGFMAEVHFLDGTAVSDATTFGKYNSDGVWVPTACSASYGTNGYYLKFDPTASNGVGHDHSGNGNHWSPSGFITTGTGQDVFYDTPTNNWVTWNSAYRDFKGNNTPNYSLGNLSGDTAGNASHFFATQAIHPGDTTGYYFEVTADSIDTVRTYIGLIDASGNSTNSEANGASYQYDYKAILDNNGVYYDYADGTGGSGGTSISGGGYSNGDTIMVAYKNGSIWLGKNGTWLQSGNPGGGTNAIATDLDTSIWWCPYAGYHSSYTANFGASRDGFKYTVPTGFKALNSSNTSISVPIKDGSKYFSTTLYTGVSGSQSVDAGMATDLAWIKSRSSSQSHSLTDRVRGNDLVLQANETSDEASGDIDLTSTGVTIGDNNALRGSAGVSYVLWSWLANGSGSALNTGSINATVSANTTACFSIITYSGNSTNNSTIAHGLGKAPEFIITKCRTGGSNNEGWPVWHKYLGNTQYFQLNNINSANTDSNIYGGSNNTAPTSTVYSVGAGGVTNTSGRTYVAYCFASVEGYCKVDEYHANNNSNGPFVYLGFAPEFLLIKSSTGRSWLMMDRERSTYNPATTAIRPGDGKDGDETNNWDIDFLSNGFKVRGTNANTNTDESGFYTYIAFANRPFKGSNVAPSPAR